MSVVPVVPVVTGASVLPVIASVAVPPVSLVPGVVPGVLVGVLVGSSVLVPGVAAVVPVASEVAEVVPESPQAASARRTVRAGRRIGWFYPSRD